jgi:Ca-activated chloride channel family protein
MKKLLGVLTAAAILCGVVLAGCSSQSSSASPSSVPSAAYAPPAGQSAPYPQASSAPSAAPAASCAPSYGAPSYGMPSHGTPPYNTEEYDALPENGFVAVADLPVSTFSADVDTASYCNVRRMLNDGYGLRDIPAGAVRTEEMLNYFKYDYAKPEGGKPFGLTAAISQCPWNEESKLLVFGITTKDYSMEDIGGCNYVFLIDTSGSMASGDKLGLLKDSLLELLENLNNRDRISIITYSGSYAVLAEGVRGGDRDKLRRIVRSLSAGGSTNGGDALIEAYALAEEYYIPYGVNRIIMCSDGDLNVGITSQSDLLSLVSEKREGGVYLSVLGFGTGNYSDSNMETLADNGNGNYYYIDCTAEAEKVLCEELVSTLMTVAKDVKFQIEFNPAYVSSYRQLGYENRQLDAGDFKNDAVDAGEVGSGCCLTVAYELIPAYGRNTAGDTELKYQSPALTEAAGSGEWMTVSIRYKEPGGSESRLLQYPIGTWDVTGDPSPDWRFAAAVCEFAMLLRGSDYRGASSMDGVLRLLGTANLGRDPYKAEFAGLVERLY